MKNTKGGPKRRLLIHAVNVHQGGGRTLLDALLTGTQTLECMALLDARMPRPPDLPASTSIMRVKPSLVARLIAERRLRALARASDTILCFGNLPPLFNGCGRVVVFLQSRYLVENASLKGMPLKDRFRLRIERVWMNMRISTVDEFIVQTPSMKDALTVYLKNKKVKPTLRITVRPFMGDMVQSCQLTSDGEAEIPIRYDFIYVASGEPHKNHRGLVEAWIKLAEAGYYPSLALTIDAVKFPELCNWIEVKKRLHRLHIENKGVLPSINLACLYECSGALIYPSTLESFGLPLLEARLAGLPILAGELDYVRDIVEPDETFDPTSPISISRAVRRHMRSEEPPLVIADVKNFLAFL